MNKKAQFESKLLAIILIVVVGIIFFFFNHVNNQLYQSFDEYFNESDSYNNSYAQEANRKVLLVEQSVWDWAFLAVFIGIIIQIVLFSYATRINVAFFWLMVLLDIPIMIVAVVLSNVWQEIAADPTFAETITRFPITDAILGSYFPTAALFLIFIGSIVLFGKRQQ